MQSDSFRSPLPAAPLRPAPGEGKGGGKGEGNGAVTPPRCATPAQEPLVPPPSSGPGMTPSSVWVFYKPPFSPQAADPGSWSRSPQHGAGCTCTSGNPPKITSFWQELRAWMTSFDAPDARPGASQLTSRLLLSSSPLAGPSTLQERRAAPKHAAPELICPRPLLTRSLSFLLGFRGQIFSGCAKFPKVFCCLFFFFFLQHLHSGTVSTPGCWPCSRDAAHKRAPKGIKEHRSPNPRSRPVPGLSKAHEHTCPAVRTTKSPSGPFFFSPPLPSTGWHPLSAARPDLLDVSPP